MKNGIDRFVEWYKNEGMFKEKQEVLFKARAIAEEERAREQGLIKELREYADNLDEKWSHLTNSQIRQDIHEILSKYEEADNGK